MFKIPWRQAHCDQCPLRAGREGVSKERWWMSGRMNEWAKQQTSVHHSLEEAPNLDGPAGLPFPGNKCPCAWTRHRSQLFFFRKQGSSNGSLEYMQLFYLTLQKRGWDAKCPGSQSWVWIPVCRRSEPVSWSLHQGRSLPLFCTSSFLSIHLAPRPPSHMDRHQTEMIEGLSQHPQGRRQGTCFWMG